jgi:hypothetical protein
MNPGKILIVKLLIILLPLNLLAQEKERVSVSQETQVLSKGSKSIFRSDIYYDKEKDVVVVHHTYPADFVKISNRFGEMKIYFPSTNSVTIKQSDSFSTTNDLLYYFVNNLVNDLGLSKEGFILASTSRENDITFTEWQAPSSIKVVSRIKMAFKDFVPVYAEYIGTKGKIVKKIYYGRYSDFQTFRLPMRITEVTFESKKDSTIRLSVFTNVKTNDFPAKNYFDFKVPDDAKITD